MKLLLEILVSLILHPIAVILAWINIAERGDLSGGAKLIWAIVSIIWGIGPILYIVVGGGELWGGTSRHVAPPPPPPSSRWSWRRRHRAL